MDILTLSLALLFFMSPALIGMLIGYVIWRITGRKSSQLVFIVHGSIVTCLVVFTTLVATMMYNMHN